MRYGVTCLALVLLAVASPAQETKTSYPPLPEAFSSFGAAVADGYVYVYGGHVAKTHTYSTEAVTGKFRRLKLADPKGWEELPAGPGLQGLALVAHGGKLYRIGGMQPRNPPGGTADNVSTAACAVFDPKLGRWQALPDLPAGRSSHDAAVVGDAIVVVGGWQLNGAGNKTDWHSTTLVLDLAKQPLQWVSIPQPFQRRALNAAVCAGLVYAVCGMGPEGDMDKSVDVLDVATGKWSTAPALPGPIRNSFGPAACSAGGRLYVSPADGKVYRLSEKKDAWKEVAALDKQRIVHRLVPAGDELLLALGGASKGGNLASVEAIEAPCGAADVWPAFRGRGDGVSAATNVPLSWSPADNIAWKIELPGYGQSSPVVWQQRIFVTAVSGAEREHGHVLAVDVNTGAKLWQHDFAPTQKAKWSYTVSKAAPTPVVDAQAVYTFFEGGNLLALAHDGKLLWSRSLVDDHGPFQGNHGLGSSPAPTDDAIVVQVDHSGPSYLLAVDKKTGKNLWKTERASRTSWTSPVVVRRGGRQEIVTSSNGSVAGYDAGTGALLWEKQGLTGNTLPSASVAGDLIVVGAGLSRLGGDPARTAQSNCCLKLVDQDGKPGFVDCWATEKAASSYASPLAYRGHTYFVNQAGVVFCIDTATGKQQYAERIDGTCWASPIGAGDHVYFFGKEGRTTVLKAGPSFVKVAANALWTEEGATGTGGYEGTIVYGVAVIDGAIIVRTGTALYRIGATKR